MPVTTYANWAGHFGMAVETVYGTTVATPTVWIPVTSLDEYTDDQGIVYDEAIRASATKLQDAYAGMEQGQYSATFSYYPEQCARLWPLILGADTVGSCSNAQWPHTFKTSTGNPFSATLFDFTPGSTVERQFVGAMMDSLNFKFSRASGTVAIKPHWISAAPSTGIAESSPSYSAVIPLRGWQPVFSIGGSTKVTLLDFDMTIARPQELVFAGNNSQRPSAAESGQVDVTGKFSVYGSTDGPYTDYRALTSREVRLLLPENDGVSGSTYSRLDIILTSAIFTNAKPDRSGQFVKWDVDFRGKYNATDGGAIQVIATVSTTSQFST